MSDELHLRDGLPPAFRYLESGCPRTRWPTLGIHPTAAHWLDIHGWFRGAMGELTDLGGLLREGRLEVEGYRRAAMPRLRQLLGNLHGHHNHESHHYFPALAALEPGMARGFELLDRDHEAIEHLLSAMADAANGLNRGVETGAEPAPLAEGLVVAVERGAGLIGRHLADEEEIVVPVLTLRGDPFQPRP